MRTVLAAKRRDFPLTFWWWWPSLFWISASDWVIQLVPVLGVLCGGGCLLGSVHSPALIFAAYVLLLSMDAANQPDRRIVLRNIWDGCLFEALFVSALLPPLDGDVASLRMRDLPSPLLSFYFRLFVFRLMFGFGKLKFWGFKWDTDK